MVRAGMYVATGVLATLAAWVAVAHFESVEAAPPSADAKAVDLTARREAVATAAKRGENVDEIRKALDAFEKSSPKPSAGAVPRELQALRDAVDTAARKGENVEAVTKELVAVEMLVAGKSLTKPRPEPRPNPADRPDAFPNPAPFRVMPNIDVAPGGIDPKLFDQAMELRRKANELAMKNPRDPELMKERQKMLAEASDLLAKAMRGGGGVAGLPAPFPDFGRVPDRVRLGIRMERVPPLAAEQLGLDPNIGIAVTLVMPDSPAEKAGLKMHDIVLEFAGKPVTDNTEDFARRVNEVKAGAKVDLVVLRKGKKVEVKGVELPEVNQFRVPPQAVPFPMLPQAVPVPLQLRPVPVQAPNADVPLAPAISLPEGFQNVILAPTEGGFTMTVSKGAIKYTITGTFTAEGNAKFGKAVVEDGGKTHTADMLTKLSEAYQADIVRLLEGTSVPRP